MILMFIRTIWTFFIWTKGGSKRLQTTVVRIFMTPTTQTSVCGLTPLLLVLSRSKIYNCKYYILLHIRMSSQIFRCTRTLFDDQNASLEACFFDEKLYNHFTTFNSSACISKVESFSQAVDYICSFYYLNFYNSSTCVQFYYSGRELFSPHPCYTFGEELARLFAVSNDPVEVVFAILFLLYLFYYELHQRKLEK